MTGFHTECTEIEGEAELASLMTSVFSVPSV